MPIDREETLKKAENFLRQGRLDQAVAEYERVVEDQPRDWTTANALGDLYLRGNKTDRAVGLYQKIADHLFTEGFYPKAAALYRKILKLAPGDEKILLNLAEISTKQGLLADAKVHFHALAKRRRERGDQAGADEIVVRIGSLDPADVEARLVAARTLEASGDKQAAAARFREVHEYLLEKGRHTEAEAPLKDAIRCDPSDPSARVMLARAAVSGGRVEEARQYLDRETAGTDPALLFAFITLEFQAGRVEQAQALLPELFALDPNRREAVVDLAWSFLDSNIFAAAACVEGVANALIASGEFVGAAAILQEFATRVPGQVNALLKLVEVCVDGGLESTMYEAQAQLADAYLAIGLASEARVIAEDLLSREPWEEAHLDRLRRALVMLKVPNVDAVLNERLSAPPDEHMSPVVREEPADLDLPARSRRLLSEKPLPPVPEPPSRARVEQAPPDDAPEPVSAGARAHAAAEIDLTTVLGDLHAQQQPSPAAPPPDLARVFAELRANNEEQEAESAEHLALARTFIEMGLPSDALGPLEIAAKSPRYRFQAGATLARLYRDAGEFARAVEWFERAAETPPDSADEGRALLYDLGVALQQAGERERALAVFLELDANAPGYRDVAARAADLTRQTGG